MTKRHFEALAKALADARKDLGLTGEYGDMWHLCVAHIAKTCKQENTRFDTARFIDACRK